MNYLILSLLVMTSSLYAAERAPRAPNSDQFSLQEQQRLVALEAIVAAGNMVHQLAEKCGEEVSQHVNNVLLAAQVALAPNASKDSTVIAALQQLKNASSQKQKPIHETPWSDK